MEKYQTLRHFIAGYFHQDWDLEGCNDVEIARLFAIKDPITARIIVSEIDQVLKMTKEKSEIVDHVLAEFGCDYRYEIDFASGYEWLMHINSIIKENISY